MSRSHSYLGIWILSLGLAVGDTGCGALSTSGSALINDPRPNGTVVGQGEFNGQNGQTITGAAQIFSMSGTQYIARLEGINVTFESALQVRVNGTTGSAPVATFALRSVTGNQNYSFSTSTSTFAAVCIFSTLRNINYGCVLF